MELVTDNGQDFGVKPGREGGRDNRQAISVDVECLWDSDKACAERVAAEPRAVR